MFNKPERRPVLVEGTAVVSLAAVVACALVSDALASPPLPRPSVGGQELSIRVATMVERIRLGEPTLRRDVAPEWKIAMWRN
jgi:hypothetical protein